jgi:uncharacterized membrane protein YfcA
MSPVVVALLVAATLVVGCLIGSVGIGGVLLTPALVYIGGMDVHEAMGTSMCAFVLTGISGTASYSRRGTLDWSSASRLALGAIPGALVGAWANGLLSEETLKLIIAALLVATGIYAIAGKEGARRERVLGPGLLAVVGLGVGFGSSLTGTGGPVLVVPTLLLLGAPALPAVGISQLAQLPIAGFGTLGFALYGEVDLLLGVGLGLLATVGVLVGVRIAHAVSAASLRQGVAGACILAGVAIAVASAPV